MVELTGAKLSKVYCTTLGSAAHGKIFEGLQ